MKSIIRTICALLILCISSYTFAIVSFRLFCAPNGKLVLILGDYHADLYSDNLETFISCIKEASLSQPLELLTEMPEELPKGEWTAAPNFMRLLKVKQSGECPNVKFTCCEPRGYISEFLEPTRKELVGIILSVVSDDEQLKHYGMKANVIRLSDSVTRSWEEARRALMRQLINRKKQRKKIDQKDTVGGFLEYLEENLTRRRAS